MDPFVAVCRSPSSRSGDDESPGCSVQANYLDDSDSIIFEGEVNESIDICNGTMPRTIRQKSNNIRDNHHDDDDDESESESDSTLLHDCRWNGCDRRFTRLKKMVTHVNDDHVRMEDVDYTCKWEGCTRQGKSFNARYKMLIHMRTHTNEKPHHCSTCLKRFSRLENLKIHTRSHTGEKPYVCPVKDCNKAYSNSSDRFKHTRTHFDDKPFVCKKEGCGKRYTDPSSLRKHMKIFGHREPTANNNLTLNRTKERAIVVVEDDGDTDDDGSGVLFQSGVDYGALTMHADIVSLTKTGKPILRKQLHRPVMAVKKTKRSAKETLVKIPGSGPLDLTITLD